MIQVECGHAMQHSPEFVDEDVGSVGFTISPDQPGSDYGLAASKLRCAIVPTSSRSIGTPQWAMDPCRHHSFWFLDAIFRVPGAKTPAKPPTCNPMASTGIMLLSVTNTLTGLNVKADGGGLLRVLGCVKIFGI